jgi:hypothetical protein
MSFESDEFKRIKALFEKDRNLQAIGRAATDITGNNFVQNELDRLNKNSSITAYAKLVEEEEQKRKLASQYSAGILKDVEFARSLLSQSDLAASNVEKLISDQMRSLSAFNKLNVQHEAYATHKSNLATYRLPYELEVTRLLESYQQGKLTEFAAIQYAEKQKFIESITAPWIKAAEIGRSFSAILELQGLGNVLRTTQGFDPELTDALRSDFGDWRDKIDFAKFELVNPVVRTDFYIARGFNSALTDLPEDAFDQSLELVGLNSHSLNVQPYDEYNQKNENFDVEVGLQRTNECHDILQRFERNLRKFINDLMVQQYGDDWPKKKLRSDTYGKWQEKRTKAEKHGDIIPLIELIDFTEYEPIICQKDHWNDIFVNIFKRKESVKESFQRLYPIRLATMHSRIVTKEDKLYLYAETVRILRAINLLQR